MNIVFLDRATLGETSLEEIESLGTLTCYETSTEEEALSRVSDCEVLITNKVKVTSALLDAAPHLRLVCEAATGVNNIDTDQCARRGIPVRNVAGYSTETVVQTTFMHILSLMGSAPYFDESVKSGHYSSGKIFTDVSRPLYELYGKRIGIIGMGTIGSRVATVAKAFGMEVVYFSTSGTGHCKDYPSLSLDEVMSTSDVISIHAPYNARTAGLIGKEELSMMKKTAIIVNMGRGGIINEAALSETINADAIGGAALDVFEKEPLPSDNALLHTAHPEKLRFTPHTGWASLEARERLVHAIALNIKQETD